jgi:hypothetical protein
LISRNVRFNELELGIDRTPDSLELLEDLFGNSLAKAISEREKALEQSGHQPNLDNSLSPVDTHSPRIVSPKQAAETETPGPQINTDSFETFPPRALHLDPEPQTTQSELEYLPRIVPIQIEPPLVRKSNRIKRKNVTLEGYDLYPLATFDYCALFLESRENITFHEAQSNQKWIQAMHSEYNSLLENNT